jgi:6,7-dimethyl-8-ribityllumazine synthase
MSSANKNLSDYNSSELPSAEKMSFGIVVSEWHPEITEALYRGAECMLLACGCKKENIFRHNVPGSFELPLGAILVARHYNVDAMICLGCVVHGETPHFDFICSAVSQGILDLSLEYKKPFIFGVLTTDTLVQAYERAGGRQGNKGIEAAASAIKMVALQKEMQGEKSSSIGFKP